MKHRREAKQSSEVKRRAISSSNIVRYLKRSEASKGSQADKGSQAVKRSEASCDIIEQYRAIPEVKRSEAMRSEVNRGREAKQTREAKQSGSQAVEYELLYILTIEL